ncbi:hypothetical protein DNU06_07070 [Putridiphycobacter roseus]|uniref:Uncharacterized protein n=2 Tax=Putridiphycobacter roseus TaxID=2219161 RepID=A0A2W1NEQ7_9FLAO|nr:hypothetical protein DNU06_07070 [Putridiphycobacter roseus]
MINGFEVVGRAGAGVVILWGVIGFFMSLIAILLLIKHDKHYGLPANSWHYLIFQIYLSIALLLFIIGGVLLGIVLLFAGMDDYQL